MSNCSEAMYGYSQAKRSAVRATPSSVARETSEARSRLTSSIVFMPVAASRAVSLPVPWYGKKAAVTVPKVLAISGL
jgi:hypothetical protein